MFGLRKQYFLAGRSDGCGGTARALRLGDARQRYGPGAICGWISFVGGAAGRGCPRPAKNVHDGPASAAEDQLRTRNDHARPAENSMSDGSLLGDVPRSERPQSRTHSATGPKSVEARKAASSNQPVFA